MARGKIESCWIEDRDGVSCLEVKKKTGKLGYDEVTEYLFDKGYEGKKLIILMEVPEQLPYDIYDKKVDIWLLYEPEDILETVHRYSR